MVHSSVPVLPAAPCICLCVVLPSPGCAPPRWAQSPGVTFDLTAAIKWRQDHFLLWTQAAQSAPDAFLLLQHKQSIIIGVDSLNIKSLHYSSDVLIGSYGEGCRGSGHVRLMFGIYRFGKDCCPHINQLIQIMCNLPPRIHLLDNDNWSPIFESISVLV